MGLGLGDRHPRVLVRRVRRVLACVARCEAAHELGLVRVRVRGRGRGRGRGRVARVRVRVRVRVWVRVN